MDHHFDVIHRNVRLFGGADYGSCEAGDLWFDPLISKHNAYAATLRKNHAAPMGPIELCHMPGYRQNSAGSGEGFRRRIAVTKILGGLEFNQCAKPLTLSIHPSVFELIDPLCEFKNGPPQRLRNSMFCPRSITAHVIRGWHMVCMLAAFLPLVNKKVFPLTLSSQRKQMLMQGICSANIQSAQELFHC